MRPFDQGYARLRELAEGLADERHVIHGDLVNRNVLVQDSQIANSMAAWRPACTIACAPVCCTSAWMPWPTTPTAAPTAGMTLPATPARFQG